ncbi:hypothetical protein BDV96DRAFT_572606 [Lophiotrema nucula]|uniref:Uncharacterized protein n=1 Tax=Lophiotrema nucula TaxID=690887 RepID=A0A6A5ZCK3_9PLEO|nr:hypothetical protein BDV96DRAFT_572606 [Lophiotrema nucula]
MTSDDDERWEDAKSSEAESQAQIDTWELERQRKVKEAISEFPDEPDQIDAIAKIRGWSGPDGYSSFYTSIQDHLNGKANLNETVDKITGPIDAMINANKLDDIPWESLWNSTIHSAKRIPFSAPKAHLALTELVIAIKRHKAPVDTQSELYSSLPYLGISSREAMNDSPGGGAGFSIPEVHAYANLQYFFALLTRGQVRAYWLYSVWVMRDALENELTDDGPNATHGPTTAFQKYDAYVPAASMWIFGVGEALYEHEADLTPTSPNQGNPGKGGKFWEGKAEISKARWALWKKRFHEVTKLEGIRDETRQLAEEAYSLMGNIDGHA